MKKEILWDTYKLWVPYPQQLNLPINYTDQCLIKVFNLIYNMIATQYSVVDFYTL